jgi:transcriptional regulator GlxA family with amidase domain
MANAFNRHFGVGSKCGHNALKLFVYLYSMKKVAILVPETAIVAAIADPRYMFSAVNQFLSSRGERPLFDIQLVGLRATVPLNDGLFSIHPDLLLDSAEKFDLIFIPALSGDMKTALELNRAFVPWIIQQHAEGAELASLCVGAFLLAETGLLNGKQCSTHWLFAHEFRQMFPEVDLQDGTIITEEQGIYSSGGASSYWNLLLYLVEKYTNREMAILASKYFALDIDRSSQSAFILFQGQKDHDDAAIKTAQDYIEQQFQDKISVEQLADLVAVGRRSFERRFKKATNNTVVAYIQRVKMEAAKRSLENTRKQVNDVMFEVGYTDSKAFREVFKKVTGITPLEYRNKFNRVMGSV